MEVVFSLMCFCMVHMCIMQMNFQDHFLSKPNCSISFSGFTP